jgi:hypothetical protein
MPKTTTKGKKTRGGKRTARALKKRLDEIGPSPAVTREARPEGQAGQPKKVIDHRTIAGLAAIHCTLEEMGAIIGVSPDTITNDPELVALIDKERLAGRMSLRRAAFSGAINGQASLLIFLLKAHCGLADRAPNGDAAPTPDASMDLPIVVVNRTVGDLPVSAGVQMVMGGLNETR